MASSWLLLSSLMVAVLMTSALTAALADFGTQVLPQAARRQLASSGQTSVVVSGAVDTQIAAADRPAVRSALRAAFGPVPFRLDSARWSDPLGLPAAGGPGRSVRLAVAAAPDQIRMHAALVSGSWPGQPQPGQPIPAALPETVARQLGLAAGDIVAVRDRNTSAGLRFRVSGLLRLRDPAGRYSGLDLIGRSGVSVQPGFTTYGPLVVSPAAFSRGALAVGQASWVALPETARIPPGDLAALAARISRSGS